MDQTVASLQEERDRLQQQVDEMTDDIQRIDELRSHVEELKGDNARLQRDNSSFEYDIAMIRKDNDSLHAKSELDAKELSRLHQANDSLSSQVNQLSATLSQREHDVQILTQQVSDLQLRDHSSSQELSQQNHLINQLQDTIQHQQTDLLACQQQLQDRQQELSSLHQSLQKVQASADDASHKVFLLQTQNDQAQTVTSRAAYLLQTVTAVLSPSQSSQKSISSTEAIAQLSAESPKEFEQSVQALQTWTQQLKEENRSLHNEVSSLEGSAVQLRETQARCASQERALSDANSQIRALQNSLEQQEKAQRAASLSSHDAVRQLQQQIHDMQHETETKHRKLCEQYNALVESYTHLQEEKNMYSKEAESLRHELEMRKQELKTTTDTLQSFQGVEMERQETLQRLQTMKAEKDEVTRRLRDMEADRVEVKNQLQEAQNQRKSDQMQLATLQSQLTSLQHDYESLRGERDSMQARLDTTTHQNEHDVDVLQSSVNRLQQQIAMINQQNQQDIEALQNRLHDQEEREQLLRNSYESTVALKTRSDQQLQLTVQELEATKQRLQESEQQSAELQEAVQRVQKEHDMAGSELRSIGRQLRELVQELTQSSTLNVSSSSVQSWSHAGHSLAELSAESPEGVEDSLRELHLWGHQLLVENRSLHDEIAALEGSVASAQKNGSAASQLISLNSQLREIQSRYSSQERTLAELRSQLSSKEQSVNALQQELQQTQDILSTRSQQLSSLQDELARTQQSLALANQNLLDMQMQSASRSSPVSTRALGTSANTSRISLSNRNPAPPDDSLDSLRSQLQSLQSEIQKLQSELSEKRTQVITLQSESSNATRRFQEAMATIQSLEATIQQLQQSSASSSAEVWTQKIESAQHSAAVLQEQVDQLTRMYNESVSQLERNTTELATLRQSLVLREQECARLNELLQNASSDATRELTMTLRLKDQQIVQLQGEVQQLRFASQQSKRETDLERQRDQRELADLRGQLAAREQDAIALAEARSQLTRKQQEVNRLQQQLLTEFGLVESMKSSFNQLDQLLAQRLPEGTQAPSLQAALKATQDHNAYLQKMIGSLESQNRELMAQKMAAESKLVQPVSNPSSVDRQQLQKIVTYLGSFFPQIILHPESVSEYVKQLGQMLNDQKSLYESLRSEWNSLQRENADLMQKVTVLKSYASGHEHIDQKADAFIQTIVEQRNEFEQQYKNAKVDLDQKNAELEQMKRSLLNEQKLVEKLQKERSKESKESKESRRQGLPPEFTSLIEECMNICLLAKLDKTKKLSTLQDIVETLRFVRRGLSSMLNLLRRENERLGLENKRIKEACAKSKKDEDRLNAKIREIIRVVQNQGKALKEFVVAFQAFQKR